MESLVTLLAPDFFGNPEDGTFWKPQGWPYYTYWSNTTLYLSVALLLAILALVFQWRNRQVRFFGALGLLGLLLSLGKYTPLYSLVYQIVPLYNKFGDVNQHLYFFSLAISILAGFGVSQLDRRATRLATVLLLPCALLAVFVFLGFQFKTAIIKLIALRWPEFLYGSTLSTIVYSLIRPAIVGTATLIVLLFSRKLSLRMLHWSLVAIIFLDMWSFGAKFTYCPVEPDLITNNKAVQHILSQDRSLYRISWPTASDFRHGRIIGGDPSNYGPVEGLFLSTGYNPLILKSYAEFINLMGGKSLSSFWSYSVPYSNIASGNYLRDLLNIKYVFSRKEIISQGLALVLDGELKVYENKQVLPRAFLVHKAEVVDSQTAVADRLRNPDFPLGEIVLLEGTQPLDLGEAGGKREDHVEITAYSANIVELEVNTNTDAILFLSEIYYPGWRAYVDGKETPVLKANYTFRSVHLKAGNHQVRFVFDPWTFKAGVAMSLMAAIILLALGIFSIRNKTG